MSSNILHFANVQKSNTCKKWAPPHTELANLDTFISTKSFSGLRFCSKIELRLHVAFKLVPKLVSVEPAWKPQV